MPGLPPGIRRIFRLGPARQSIERDVDDEIRFHLEMRAAELVARGRTPEAARAEALQRFGDTRQWSESMTAVDHERLAVERRSEWLDDLRQDVRYGLRSLRRAPLFALLAILTLALGIGANAAIFGVVKSVLIDALPYENADRLVRVYGRFLDGTIPRAPLNAGAVADIAERQRSFGGISAFMMDAADAVLDHGDAPRVVSVSWVEPDLFATLGVRAAVGATFDETASPDSPPVALLSHAAWQRSFGGDAAVVGRQVRLDGDSRTIVGVLPRRFVGPGGDADLYVPLDLAPILRDPVRARGENWLGVVGRLAPGATVASAQGDLDAVAAGIAREQPTTGNAMGLAVMPLRTALVGDTRAPLLVLMASAGLVLVITCANLAGALMSRTISRRGEFAVRVALGAGRARLVRQVLTESLLLALAGGVAGIGVAIGALALLRGFVLPALPSWAGLSVDGPAMSVAVITALVTGVGFGLAPAFSAGRTNAQGMLREEARGTSESRRSRHLRGVLVASQIALCVSLVAGAGLLLRSLLAMTNAPLGFEATGAVSAAVRYSGSAYWPEDARVRFQDLFEERLRAIPGIEGVALASALPTTVQSRSGFTKAESPWPAGASVPFVLYASVSDDYFRTLGIPLRAGRTFSADDRPGGARAIVISEAMARRYWPDGSALGSRIRMGPDPQSPLLEVIGIVGDVRNDPARMDAEPMAYGSGRQFPWGSLSIVLRGSGEPASLVQAAREALASIDPALPLDRIMPLAAVIDERFLPRRLPVALMTSFGALALLLASVGVYGLFASMVASREREFGVRIALGSTPLALAGLVLRQGAVWIAAGLGGGAVGIVVTAHIMRGQLQGVSPFDPVTLGATAAMLVTCAAAALLVPLRRAIRADPIRALK